MKTVILPSKMMFRGKPLTTAALLILVMNVFRGQTLTCHRAEYLIGNECCPMCPAGTRVKTDCTEIRNTSCLPCVERTFMNQPTGRKQCFPCTNCDAGSGLKTKTSCTTTSDAVCEPLEGFYCVDSADGGCVATQKHTSCRPGQYIRQNGTALRDTECSDCSGGTFSDGTFTSCRPHTQCGSINLQLRAGTASADAECGEQSSDTTGTVIIVAPAVVGLFLLIGASVAVLYYLRKKKRCLHRERKTNAENPQQFTKQEPLSGKDNRRVHSCRLRHFLFKRADRTHQSE